MIKVAKLMGKSSPEARPLKPDKKEKNDNNQHLYGNDLCCIYVYIPL